LAPLSVNGLQGNCTGTEVSVTAAPRGGVEPMGPDTDGRRWQRRLHTYPDRTGVPTTRTPPSLGTGQQTDRPECGGNWAHRQDHSPAVVRPPTDHSNEWLTTGSLTTAMAPAVGCGSRPKWRLEWTPIWVWPVVAHTRCSTAPTPDQRGGVGPPNCLDLSGFRDRVFAVVRVPSR